MFPKPTLSKVGEELARADGLTALGQTRWAMVGAAALQGHGAEPKRAQRDGEALVRERESETEGERELSMPIGEGDGAEAPLPDGSTARARHAWFASKH